MMMLGVVYCLITLLVHDLIILLVIDLIILLVIDLIISYRVAVLFDYNSLLCLLFQVIDLYSNILFALF